MNPVSGFRFSLQLKAKEKKSDSQKQKKNREIEWDGVSPHHNITTRLCQLCVWGRWQKVSPKDTLTAERIKFYGLCGKRDLGMGQGVHQTHANSFRKLHLEFMCANSASASHALDCFKQKRAEKEAAENFTSVDFYSWRTYDAQEVSVDWEYILGKRLKPLRNCELNHKLTLNPDLSKKM